MSDETRQKVYDAAKRWVADAEQPLEELIAAIKEHRTAERDEANPTPASDQESQSPSGSETGDGASDEPVQEPASTDPPEAA